MLPVNQPPGELSPSQQILLRAAVARITTLVNKARKIHREQTAIVAAVDTVQKEKTPEAWAALRTLLQDAKAD